MQTGPLHRAIAALAAATAVGGLASVGQVATATAAAPQISAQGAPVALSPVPPTTSPTGALVGVALGRTASRSVHDIQNENGDTGPAPNRPLAPRHGPTNPGHHTPIGGVQATPAPGAAPSNTSFEGTNNTDAVLPPDTDGAVGPNDYVELVNTHYEVFNKSGTPLAGPIETTQLFSRFAHSTSGAQLCYYNAGGDGIVLYDRAADRWLVTQLGFTEGVFGPQGPFVECMAVSQTSDPTGAYYAYAFLLDSSNLPDYPKFGIFGNSYYLSANLYSSVFASSGNPAVWAFDRNTMLAGGLPQSVEFAGDVPDTYNTILPANVNGAIQPPAGEPETYAGMDFANNTTLGIFQFSQVNWNNPGAATFTGPINLTVAPYSTMCGLSQDCLPQPGTGQLLDAISDRVMQPLSYRNLGDHEALVMDHTVNVSTTGGNQAGVRWYEIDRRIVSGNTTNQPFTIAQQGTYAPDGNNRWMASTAMDGAGDMALGYSIGSASMYPSIAFTGRSKCDAPNQMTVPEGTIQPGAGAQTGANRWGDYTDMSVDPTDDTTFWYVGEYYSTTSASGWQTRIGSFRVPSCGTDTIPPTITWTAPANNAYVHGAVTLSANATDDGTVAGVAFYAGATLLTTVTSAPYQTTWDTTSTADGTPVTLKAVATDGAGLQSTATETVTVDNSPPTVSITSPSPGAALSGTVPLTAAAGDAGSPVAQVDFLVDGNVVGTSTASPYNTSWSSGTVPNGPHVLTARATDEAGNVTTSTAVNVTVNNAPDTTPPTVTWTAPANNADVGGTVTLTANATDDTNVTSVVFAANGTNVATVTSPPYQASWNTTTGYADGSPVTLTATATDSVGLQTSAAETVTVDNSPPTVSLTSPSSGATLTGTVNLTATAADVGSPVAKVDFLVDANIVATSTATPYTASWGSATLANGPHTLAARATDGAGNVTTSSGVLVTVDNAPPSVSWTTPANNADVRGTVTLTANATDDTTVASVAFSANGTPVATVTSTPYSTTWNTTGLANGTKVTLTATATDAVGLQSTTSETVTVDNSPPTVSVTAPTAGSVLSGSVPLTATAADAGSSVAKVEFLVDGNVVGTSTASPWGVMWNSTTVANGSHSVTARATDGAGNATASAAVAVSVNNAGTVMQISSLVEYGSLGFSTWKAWATVTVVDQHGNPVSGATVTFSFTGGATATKTCKTGSNGSCSTSGNKVTVPLSNPTENVVTTNVTKSGATWNGVKYSASLTG
jgi:hypothetical protein